MFLLGTFVGQQFTEPCRPRRPRLLPLPGDQPEVGPGLARRADRRLHARARAEERRRAPRSCSTYLGSAAAENIYLTTDPNDIGGEQGAEHVRSYSALQKKAADDDRGREAHRAVHGPRHAARLRLDGDDPVAADVPQQPERRRTALVSEHPEAEDVDLRLAERLGSARWRRGPARGRGRRGARAGGAPSGSPPADQLVDRA